MATVKSLEDRIDEMSTDMSRLSTSIAVLTSKMDATQVQLSLAVNAIQTTQVQLSMLATKLDIVVERLSPVEKKLEVISSDYLGFKSKMDTAYAMVKWLGAFAATVAVTIIGSTIYVATKAGDLNSRMEHHLQSLQEIKAEQQVQHRSLEEIKLKQK